MTTTKIKGQRQEDITRQLANQFIAALSEDKLPWTNDFNRINLFPQNPASGTIYQGTTRVILMIQSTLKEYNDPRWMTYKQAKMLDAQVMKGEKATMCIHWQPIKVPDLDKDGKIILNADGTDKTKEILIPCPYSLFNVKQIEGLNLPPLEVQHDVSWNPHERCETLIKNSQAIIKHELGIYSPYYSPTIDEIHMPTKGQFHSSNAYYDTLLHEMCHWTGHASRMNRLKSKDILTENYKEEYAREELRAEIGSSILSLTLGIDHTISGSDHDLDNHKAYVKSWIKVLDNNPREILYATAQADKIVSYLRQYDPVKDPKLIPLLNQNQENAKVYISKPEQLNQIKNEIKQDINERVKDAVERDKLSYTLEPIPTDEKNKKTFFSANYKTSIVPSMEERQRLAKKENVRRINLSDGKIFLTPDRTGNFYEISKNSLTNPNTLILALAFMEKNEISSVLNHQREYTLQNFTDIIKVKGSEDFMKGAKIANYKTSKLPNAEELQRLVKEENVRRINFPDGKIFATLDNSGNFIEITQKNILKPDVIKIAVEVLSRDERNSIIMQDKRIKTIKQAEDKFWSAMLDTVDIPVAEFYKLSPINKNDNNNYKQATFNNKNDISNISKDTIKYLVNEENVRRINTKKSENKIYLLYPEAKKIIISEINSETLKDVKGKESLAMTMAKRFMNQTEINAVLHKNQTKER